MSLKDYFQKKNLKPTSLDSLKGTIESPHFLAQKRENLARFLPSVDFSDPANFAFFGSAEKYYNDSFKRIYTAYPYDGSFLEQEQWYASSSYIDLFIFEKKYPRTTGYVNFSPTGWGTKALPAQLENVYGSPTIKEYISFFGGPNVKNVYKPENKLESNLKISGIDGNSVEFWLKKKELVSNSLTNNEVIFDAYTVGIGSNTEGYGRFRIELKNGTGDPPGTPFLITYQSASSAGAQGPLRQTIGSISTAAVCDNNWHHYAFTIKHDSTNNKLVADLYVDGVHNETKDFTGIASFGHITTAVNGALGGLAANNLADTAFVGAGKLSGSLDEFRFWKEKRTAKQIGQNYFKSVAGGTNKSDVNANLGIYYKFNEGITGTASIDQTVLDYSGRVSNGTFYGYNTYTRNVGSAIDLSPKAATLNWAKEFKDPILYPDHPEYSSSLNTLVQRGKAHDENNTAAIYSSIPLWMKREDRGTKSLLLELTQIFASYFDTAFLQIKSLPILKNKEYKDFFEDSVASDGSKPVPFIHKALESAGFLTPELFADARVLERFANQDDFRQYESQLEDVKNFIYTNIYNNLTHIYKTKGTEKSFRNLFRCFGIDDEVIRLNIYGKNSEFVIEDSPKYSSKREAFIDFDNSKNHNGIFYQDASPIGNATRDCINTSYETIPFTAEVDIMTPEKFDVNSPYYRDAGFLESSIFGCYEPASDEKTTFSSGGTSTNKFILVDSLVGGHPWAGATITVGDGTSTRVITLANSSGTDNIINMSEIASNNETFAEKLAEAINGSSGGSVNVTAEVVSGIPNRLKLSHDSIGSITFEIARNSAGANPADKISQTDGGGTTGIAEFQVYVEKTTSGGKDGKFVLKSDTGLFEPISSRTILDLYDNKKWTLAVSVKPIDYPFTDAVTGSRDPGTYTIQFYGVHYIQDELIDSFLVTGTANRAAGTALSKNKKKFYVGAKRTNFTGSVLRQTDILVSSFRYWQSLLSNEEVNNHAIYSSYGQNRVYEQAHVYENSGSLMDIPKFKTLSVHWDFNNLENRGVTDGVGAVRIGDYSSGSSDATDDQYGAVLGQIVNRSHPGRGFGFPALTDITDYRYINIANKNEIEQVFSSNMIKVEDFEQKNYGRDHKPQELLFAIEKSAYDVVSSEILNFFGTITDFNNLIGEPVNKYRQEYKYLEKLRDIFFSRVKNTPSIEKFVEYYKWFDSAIGVIIQNLKPASLNMVSDLRTLVESHILERNKYWHKFPTLEMKAQDPFPSIRGIGELLYDWEHGHAPIEPFHIESRLNSIVNASDLEDGDNYGVSVSISGDYAIVGASDEDTTTSRTGAAYIFKRSGDSWSQIQKIQASDKNTNDRFGSAVSISGDTALIGAERDDDKGSDSGSAYIFERDEAGNWTEKAKLTANDGAANVLFGSAVSLSGNTALIGAQRDNDNGSQSGAAYIFQRDAAGNWTQTAKLTANDGAAGDFFGYRVSLSGDAAIIGAIGIPTAANTNGSAYIFQRNAAGNWNQAAKLTASDGASGDRFGFAVSLSGETALVTATGDDDNGSDSGSAYVFTRDDDGNWTQKAKLTADDAAVSDEFGKSVAITDSIIAIGSPHTPSGTGGAVYLFENSGPNYRQLKKILHPNITTSVNSAGADFGEHISLSNTHLLIGAPDDEGYGAANTGAAYIFDIVRTFKENNNCLWWKDRAERLTSANPKTNEQRDIINRIRTTDVSGSTYATRQLSRPYRFLAERSRDLVAGNNTTANKLPDLYKAAIPFAGATPGVLNFTFSDMPADNSTITLISADGTQKTYKYVPAASANNGDILAPGIVAVRGSGLVGIARQAAAHGLTAAIEHANGHAGKLIVDKDFASIKITQKVLGAEGNTVVTTSTGFTNATSTNPAATFTGGKSQLSILKTDIQPAASCNDKLIPNKKNRIFAKTDVHGTEGYMDGDADLILPFTLMSSSIDDPFLSAFIEKAKITNAHLDTYGPTTEVPLQGPFAQEHVGGQPHRHGNLLEGDPTNRIEGYKLVATPNRLEIQNTSTDSPNNLLVTRDGMTKSPVNIKNIQTVTGSVIQGNYNNPYDYFNTSGRSLNNQGFVKDTSTSKTSAVFANSQDRAKPEREVVKNVIAVRFAGDNTVTGDHRGGPNLDRDYGEFSANNSMNMRNALQRETLNLLSAEKSQRFGIRSGSEVGDVYSDKPPASFHKINRNPKFRNLSSDAYNIGNNPSVVVAYTNQPSDGDTITFISTDGTSKTYEFDNNSTVGVGNILVTISNDADATYAALKTAIDGATGHNAGSAGSKIIVTHTDNNSNNGTITFAQKVGGAAANTVVTSTLSNVVINNGRAGRVNAQGELVFTNGVVFRKSFDNLFVQRPIPQSDIQYTWITASSLDTTRTFSGYQHNFTVPYDETTSRFQEELAFLSSSDVGSYITDNNLAGPGQRFFGLSNPNSMPNVDKTTNNFVPTSFVGINTNIFEPVSSSSNILGYPNFTAIDIDADGLAVVEANYINQLFVPGQASGEETFGDVASADFGNTKVFAGVHSVLNALIHHRGGSYGYPSWKQMRTAEHPIVRSLRKNNLYSISVRNNESNNRAISGRSLNTYKFGNENTRLGEATDSPVVLHKFDREVKNYYENPVSARFKPVNFAYFGTDNSLNIRFSEQEKEMDDFEIDWLYPNRRERNVLIGGQLSYGNKISTFANKELVNILKLGELNNNAEILNLFMSYTDFKGGDVPTPDSIYYTENIYPRENETFRLRTRSRTRYMYSLWKALRINRATQYKENYLLDLNFNKIGSPSVTTPGAGANTNGLPFSDISITNLDTDSNSTLDTQKIAILAGDQTVSVKTVISDTLRAKGVSNVFTTAITLESLSADISATRTVTIKTGTAADNDTSEATGDIPRVKVDFSGPDQNNITITITPDSTPAESITTAELVELIQTGAVSGKLIQITGTSSYRTTLKASGGGSELLPDGSSNDGDTITLSQQTLGGVDIKARLTSPGSNTRTYNIAQRVLSLDGAPSSRETMIKYGGAGCPPIVPSEAGAGDRKFFRNAEIDMAFEPPFRFSYAFRALAVDNDEYMYDNGGRDNTYGPPEPDKDLFIQYKPESSSEWITLEKFVNTVDPNSSLGARIYENRWTLKEHIFSKEEFTEKIRFRFVSRTDRSALDGNFYKYDVWAVDNIKVENLDYKELKLQIEKNSMDVKLMNRTYKNEIIKITSSISPLDSRQDFSILPLNLTHSFRQFSGSSYSVNTNFDGVRTFGGSQGTFGEGELQNDYNTWHLGHNREHYGAPPSALYARRWPQKTEIFDLRVNKSQLLMNPPLDLQFTDIPRTQHHWPYVKDKGNFGVFDAMVNKTKNADSVATFAAQSSFGYLGFFKPENLPGKQTLVSFGLPQLPHNGGAIGIDAEYRISSSGTPSTGSNRQHIVFHPKNQFIRPAGQKYFEPFIMAQSSSIATSSYGTSAPDPHPWSFKNTHASQGSFARTRLYNPVEVYLENGFVTASFMNTHKIASSVNIHDGNYHMIGVGHDPKARKLFLSVDNTVTDRTYTSLGCTSSFGSYVPFSDNLEYSETGVHSPYWVSSFHERHANGCQIYVGHKSRARNYESGLITSEYPSNPSAPFTPGANRLDTNKVSLLLGDSGIKSDNSYIYNTYAAFNAYHGINAVPSEIVLNRTTFSQEKPYLIRWCEPAFDRISSAELTTKEDGNDSLNDWKSRRAVFYGSKFRISFDLIGKNQNYHTELGKTVEGSLSPLYLMVATSSLGGGGVNGINNLIKATHVAQTGSIDGLYPEVHQHFAPQLFSDHNIASGVTTQFSSSITFISSAELGPRTVTINTLDAADNEDFAGQGVVKIEFSGTVADTIIKVTPDSSPALSLTTAELVDAINGVSSASGKLRDILDSSNLRETLSATGGGPEILENGRGGRDSASCKLETNHIGWKVVKKIGGGDIKLLISWKDICTTFGLEAPDAQSGGNSVIHNGNAATEVPWVNLDGDVMTISDGIDPRSGTWQTFSARDDSYIRTRAIAFQDKRGPTGNTVGVPYGTDLSGFDVGLGNGRFNLGVNEASGQLYTGEAYPSLHPLIASGDGSQSTAAKRYKALKAFADLLITHINGVGSSPDTFDANPVDNTSGAGNMNPELDIFAELDTVNSSADAKGVSSAKKASGVTTQLTNNITFTSDQFGTGDNGRTVTITTTAAANNDPTGPKVVFDGTRAATTITITPNIGSANTNKITTAQLVELINNGSVIGKSVTLVDESNLRQTLSATGGGAQNFTNNSDDDDATTAAFTGGGGFITPIILENNDPTQTFATRTVTITTVAEAGNPSGLNNPHLSTVYVTTTGTLDNIAIEVRPDRQPTFTLTTAELVEAINKAETGNLSTGKRVRFFGGDTVQLLSSLRASGGGSEELLVGTTQNAGDTIQLTSSDDNGDQGDTTYNPLMVIDLKAEQSLSEVQINFINSASQIYYDTDGPEAGNKITINGKRYVFVDHDSTHQNGSIIITGNTLGEGDVIVSGGSALGSSDANIGGFAVVIPRNSVGQPPFGFRVSKNRETFEALEAAIKLKDSSLSVLHIGDPLPQRRRKGLMYISRVTPASGQLISTNTAETLIRDANIRTTRAATAAATSANIASFIKGGSMVSTDFSDMPINMADASSNFTHYSIDYTHQSSSGGVTFDVNRNCVFRLLNEAYEGASTQDAAKDTGWGFKNFKVTVLETADNSDVTTTDTQEYQYFRALDDTNSSFFFEAANEISGLSSIFDIYPAAFLPMLATSKNSMIARGFSSATDKEIEELTEAEILENIVINNMENSEFRIFNSVEGSGFTYDHSITLPGQLPAIQSALPGGADVIAMSGNVAAINVFKNILSAESLTAGNFPQTTVQTKIYTRKNSFTNFTLTNTIEETTGSATALGYSTEIYKDLVFVGRPFRTDGTQASFYGRTPARAEARAAHSTEGSGGDTPPYYTNQPLPPLKQEFGVVYTYKSSSSGYSKNQELYSPYLQKTGGSDLGSLDIIDLFGYSVAPFPDAVAIGAAADVSELSKTDGTLSLTKGGAVHIYKKVTSVGSELFERRQTLVADDSRTGDLFGSSVATSENGHIIAVGAPGNDSSRGAVYIFSGSTDHANARFSFSGFPSDGSSVTISDLTGHSRTFEFDSNNSVVSSANIRVKKDTSPVSLIFKPSTRIQDDNVSGVSAGTIGLEGENFTIEVSDGSTPNSKTYNFDVTTLGSGSSGVNIGIKNIMAEKFNTDIESNDIPTVLAAQELAFLTAATINRAGNDIKCTATVQSNRVVLTPDDDGDTITVSDITSLRENFITNEFDDIRTARAFASQVNKSDLAITAYTYHNTVTLVQDLASKKGQFIKNKRIVKSTNLNKVTISERFDHDMFWFQKSKFTTPSAEDSLSSIEINIDEFTKAARDSILGTLDAGAINPQEFLMISVVRSALGHPYLPLDDSLDNNYRNYNENNAAFDSAPARVIRFANLAGDPNDDQLREGLVKIPTGTSGIRPESIVEGIKNAINGPTGFSFRNKVTATHAGTKITLTPAAGYDLQISRRPFDDGLTSGNSFGIEGFNMSVTSPRRFGTMVDITPDGKKVIATTPKIRDLLNTLYNSSNLNAASATDDNAIYVRETTDYNTWTHTQKIVSPAIGQGGEIATNSLQFGEFDNNILTIDDKLGYSEFRLEKAIATLYDQEFDTKNVRFNQAKLDAGPYQLTALGPNVVVGGAQGPFFEDFAEYTPGSRDSGYRSDVQNSGKWIINQDPDGSTSGPVFYARMKGYKAVTDTNSQPLYRSGSVPTRDPGAARGYHPAASVCDFYDENDKVLAFVSGAISYSAVVDPPSTMNTDSSARTAMINQAFPTPCGISYKIQGVSVGFPHANTINRYVRPPNLYFYNFSGSINDYPPSLQLKDDDSRQGRGRTSLALSDASDAPAFPIWRVNVPAKVAPLNTGANNNDVFDGDGTPTGFSSEDHKALFKEGVRVFATSSVTGPNAYHRAVALAGYTTTNDVTNFNSGKFLNCTNTADSHTGTNWVQDDIGDGNFRYLELPDVYKTPLQIEFLAANAGLMDYSSSFSAPADGECLYLQYNALQNDGTINPDNWEGLLKVDAKRLKTRPGKFITLHAYADSRKFGAEISDNTDIRLRFLSKVTDAAGYIRNSSEPGVAAAVTKQNKSVFYIANITVHASSSVRGTDGSKAPFPMFGVPNRPMTLQYSGSNTGGWQTLQETQGSNTGSRIGSFGDRNIAVYGDSVLQLLNADQAQLMGFEGAEINKNLNEWQFRRANITSSLGNVYFRWVNEINTPQSLGTSVRDSWLLKDIFITNPNNYVFSKPSKTLTIDQNHTHAVASGSYIGFDESKDIKDRNIMKFTDACDLSNGFLSIPNNVATYYRDSYEGSVAESLFFSTSSFFESTSDLTKLKEVFDKSISPWQMLDFYAKLTGSFFPVDDSTGFADVKIFTPNALVAGSVVNGFDKVGLTERKDFDGTSYVNAHRVFNNYEGCSFSGVQSFVSPTNAQHVTETKQKIAIVSENHFGLGDSCRNPQLSADSKDSDSAVSVKTNFKEYGIEFDKLNTNFDKNKIKLFQTKNHSYHADSNRYASPSGIETIARFVHATSSFFGRRKQNEWLSGESKWLAPSSSEKQPVYENYDSYREEFRAIGKDYALVPEYRTSEYMDSYVENGVVNYFKKSNLTVTDSENRQFIVDQKYTLTGSSLSIGDSEFYNAHFFTDFMKYFDVVKSPGVLPGNIGTHSLRCSALLKLLPYEGFYPVDRTLQLVNIYANEYISGSIEEDTRTTSANLSILTKQFFAPGILYNSIKSGIAVDYPIFNNETEYSGSIKLNDGTINSSLLKQEGYGASVKGSFINSTEDTRSNILATYNNYKNTQGGASPRLDTDTVVRTPFEAIINPNIIGNSSIYDNEPHPSGSIIRAFAPRVTNDGQVPFRKENKANYAKYALAMNNFVAETINFFMENGNLTSFKSVPGPYPVGQDAVNRKHKMRFYVENENSSIYERESAFGPPVEDTKMYRENGGYFGDFGFRPFHPAFLRKNNASMVEFEFTPKESKEYELSEIISQITASYITDFEINSNISPDITKRREQNAFMIKRSRFDTNDRESVVIPYVKSSVEQSFQDNEVSKYRIKNAFFVRENRETGKRELHKTNKLSFDSQFQNLPVDTDTVSSFETSNRDPSYRFFLPFKDRYQIVPIDDLLDSRDTNLLDFTCIDYTNNWQGNTAYLEASSELVTKISSSMFSNAGEIGSSPSPIVRGVDNRNANYLSFFCWVNPSAGENTEVMNLFSMGNSDSSFVFRISGSAMQISGSQNKNYTISTSDRMNLQDSQHAVSRNHWNLVGFTMAISHNRSSSKAKKNVVFDIYVNGKSLSDCEMEITDDPFYGFSLSNVNNLNNSPFDLSAFDAINCRLGGAIDSSDKNSFVGQLADISIFDIPVKGRYARKIYSKFEDYFVPQKDLNRTFSREGLASNLIYHHSTVRNSTIDSIQIRDNQDQSLFFNNAFFADGAPNNNRIIPGSLPTGTVYRSELNTNYNEGMYLNSSFNLFGVEEIPTTVISENVASQGDARNETKKVWTIQPKWELPVLDFSTTPAIFTSIGVTGSISVITSSSDYAWKTSDLSKYYIETSRGLWHQYSKVNNGYSAGLTDSDLAPGEKSLLQLCKFDTQPKKIGVVREKKTISEAIVAIPFRRKGNNFVPFRIPKSVLDNFFKGTLSEDDNVSKQIKMMQKYVLPPKYDFATYGYKLQENRPQITGGSLEGVIPVKMYIFEFEVELNKEDLLNIWQNLPPRIALHGESPQDKVVSHELLAPDGRIPDDIRWQVFKVKRKASSSYLQKVNDSLYDTEAGNLFRKAKANNANIITPSIDEKIPASYNWPYDFFSLIELIKIDSKVTFEQ